MSLRPHPSMRKGPGNVRIDVVSSSTHPTHALQEIRRSIAVMAALDAAARLPVRAGGIAASGSAREMRIEIPAPRDASAPHGPVAMIHAARGTLSVRPTDGRPVVTPAPAFVEHLVDGLAPVVIAGALIAHALLVLRAAEAAMTGTPEEPRRRDLGLDDLTEEGWIIGGNPVPWALAAAAHEPSIVIGLPSPWTPARALRSTELQEEWAELETADAPICIRIDCPADSATSGARQMTIGPLRLSCTLSDDPANPRRDPMETMRAVAAHPDAGRPAHGNEDAGPGTATTSPEATTPEGGEE